MFVTQFPYPATTIAFPFLIISTIIPSTSLDISFFNLIILPFPPPTYYLIRKIPVSFLHHHALSLSPLNYCQFYQDFRGAPSIFSSHQFHQSQNIIFIIISLMHFLPPFKQFILFFFFYVCNF